jgi:DNA polymerase III subunit beta
LKAEGTKATIHLAELNHALKLVERAIARNTTIPILSCVRMEKLPSGLALEATNLDLTIRAVMTDETDGPDRPLVMPAEHFICWTKLLSGDDVKISATDKRATLTSGRARAVLPVFSADQWPINGLPAIAGDGINYPQTSLKRALSFAALSMNTGESRYNINGVLLQGDGAKLTVVSTEGHCMTIYTLASQEKIDLLLPAKLIKAMLPLLGDTDSTFNLSIEDKRILATIGDEKINILLSSGKLAGKFPEWKACLPAEERVSITFDAAEMRNSLERCMLLSDGVSGCVRLTFTDQITIDASSAENGEARETVPCLGHSDDSITVGICGDYLLNLLKKLDGKIIIDLPTNNMKPLLFRAEPHENEDLTYIIMPMRF